MTRSTADGRVDRAQLTTHECRERGRVARGAKDEMLRERAGLPERQVDLGLGAQTEIFGPRISDDADDLDRLVTAAGKLKVRPIGLRSA